jgi:hypothetical protein
MTTTTVQNVLWRGQSGGMMDIGPLTIHLH